MSLPSGCPGTGASVGGDRRAVPSCRLALSIFNCIRAPREEKGVAAGFFTFTQHRPLL